MQKPQKSRIKKKVEHKIGLAKATGWTLTSLGALAIIASIVYASSILAFIGLGLLFWGIILTYIQTEEYVKETLLGATAIPSLTTLDQIIQELDHKGKAVYLPPKYFKAPEANKAYIPKQKDGKLPTPEQIQEQENRLFIENPKGILLTPPGAEMTKLFEETLGTSFTKVDIEYLQKNLPKIFIEDLEIAENLEMEIKYNKVGQPITATVSLIQIKNHRIHVKITNSVYKDICKETRKLPQICGVIGCQLCSAIACAIAKASGSPVTIEKTEATEDCKIIEAYYTIIGEKE